MPDKALTSQWQRFSDDREQRALIRLKNALRVELYDDAKDIVMKKQVLKLR